VRQSRDQLLVDQQNTPLPVTATRGTYPSCAANRKKKSRGEKGRQELVGKDPLKSRFRGEFCTGDTCSVALRFGDQVGDSAPVAVGFDGWRRQLSPRPPRKASCPFRSLLVGDADAFRSMEERERVWKVAIASRTHLAGGSSPFATLVNFFYFG
jgi:hypothetical protein